MMKYCYLFIVIALSFTACKSKEDKAQEVIKAELFKTLDEYSSYEAIETKVDSSFTSIYNDPQISSWAATFGFLLKSIEESSRQLDEVKSNMQIWKGSSSLFGLNKYTDAHREYNRMLKEGQDVLKTMGELSDSIKAKKETLSVPVFNGWKVHHKFRSKNKEGNFVISDQIYIFDKDMKNIVDEYDIQDIEPMKSRVMIDMALRFDSENE